MRCNVCGKGWRGEDLDVPCDCEIAIENEEREAAIRKEKRRKQSLVIEDINLDDDDD